MMRRPPRSPLFPSAPLFRSVPALAVASRYCNLIAVTILNPEQQAAIRTERIYCAVFQLQFPAAVVPSDTRFIKPGRCRHMFQYGICKSRPGGNTIIVNLTAVGENQIDEGEYPGSAGEEHLVWMRGAHSE